MVALTEVLPPPIPPLGGPVVEFELEFELEFPAPPVETVEEESVYVLYPVDHYG
jgi:hypothetical protein